MRIVAGARSAPATLLAWATGLLPMLAVTVCAIVSMHQGLVTACFPFIDGCTSVSATGRYELPYFIFKGLVIPAGVLLMGFWLVTGAWLDARGRTRSAWVIVSIGFAGGAFLILYATFLGSEGPPYDWLRRFGARMYFALTAFGQLLLTWAVWRISPPPRPAPLRMMLALCAIQLAIGLASLPIPLIVQDPTALQNVVEWNYGLAMLIFFPVVGRLWTTEGLRVQVVRGDG